MSEVRVKVSRGGTWCVLRTQAELQLAKERLRRKSAVLERQEEEIAARGKSIDTAAVYAKALQHACNRAQQDADARKVRHVILQKRSTVQR